MKSTVLKVASLPSIKQAKKPANKKNATKYEQSEKLKLNIDSFIKPSSN